MHLLGTSSAPPPGTPAPPLHIIDASAPPRPSLEASAPPLHLLCIISSGTIRTRLLPPWHFLAQTYAFGTGVAAMGVTLTAAGLTSKSVILATTAGQLAAINKNLLDPRRPLVHPSRMRQLDREEGLIPYASTLGSINPLTVLTHRHTIARPAHVLTAPTTLESTSLVVGVGLDSW